MFFSSLSCCLPPVIGHRGACGYAPENTLASLSAAAQLGVKWIEFDIMLTKEGEAIVFHDDTLNRTTNGIGLVADTTYATIATLDAGSWFSPEFAGEKIPTFVEYLENAVALGLGINVEIKPTPGKDRDTAKKVVELLRHNWPNGALPPLVSSFSIEALTTARELDQTLYLGLLLDHWLKDWQKICRSLACVSVNINHSLLNAKKVQQVKACAPYVLAYTVNSVVRAEELFAMGVDGIFSDRLTSSFLPSGRRCPKGG